MLYIKHKGRTKGGSFINSKNDIVQVLCDKAINLLSKNKEAVQAVVLYTESGRMYHYMPDDSFNEEAEDAFLQAFLKKADFRVLYILCLWREGCVDLPSMRFRQKLLSICPANADAQLILQGEKGILIKPLCSSMP